MSVPPTDSGVRFGLPEFFRDWGMPTQSALSSQWTIVNGLRMHSRATAQKDAPRFLLIHGMVISSLYMIPLAETLAAHGFEVHAIDLPGYGRSEKSSAPLDVRALADATAGWIRAQGDSPWHLVGNSMGCQVGADLAARDPHHVATLTLIGMTVDPAARSLLRQAFRLFLDMPREPWRLWLNHVVDYLRAGPRFVVGAIRSMMADRIETKLPQISAPTLLIRGERDPVTPRTWTSQAMTMLRDVQFAEIPRGTHAVHYSQPRPVADEIAKFVTCSGDILKNAGKIL